MSFAGDYLKKVRAGAAAADRQPFTDADAYRAALEKAAYGDAGAQYGQGLDSITRYLAGAGPLADSGAATALRARLASQIYGGARSRIQGGYADYLGQSLRQRQAYQYQLALMKAQKKMNKRNILGSLAGGVAGALTGGPVGAAAGYQMGNDFGGGYSTGGASYG